MTICGQSPRSSSDLLAVLPGQDHADQTVRGKGLLLDAADRQQLPGERHLATQADGDARQPAAASDLRAGMRGAPSMSARAAGVTLDRRLVPLGPAADHLAAQDAEHLASSRTPAPGAAADHGSNPLRRNLDLIRRQSVPRERPVIAGIPLSGLRGPVNANIKSSEIRDRSGETRSDDAATCRPGSRQRTPGAIHSPTAPSRRLLVHRGRDKHRTGHPPSGTIAKPEDSGSTLA